MDRFLSRGECYTSNGLIVDRIEGRSWAGTKIYLLLTDMEASIENESLHSGDDARGSIGETKRQSDVA
jgi:hypothetical protein